MNQAEKRRYPRVNFQTTVQVFDRTPRQGQWDPRPQVIGRFEVVNVSAGGALIAGDIAAPLGANLGIHLKLPGTEVQLGSVLVRKGDPTMANAFAVSFQVAPVRDKDAVERAVAALLDSTAPSRPSASLNVVGPVPPAPAKAGRVRTAIGSVWHTLRELESMHLSQCGHCHVPFALPTTEPGDSCRHGQDLRSLLQALTMVLVDRDQYPNTLRTCRALTLEKLGRDLDGMTKDLLQVRLEEPAAQTLCGRRPLPSLRLQPS
jgi:hypothetical protein